MNSKIILLLGSILASLVVFLCLKDQYTKTNPIVSKVITPIISPKVDKNITKIEQNQTKVLVTKKEDKPKAEDNTSIKEQNTKKIKKVQVTKPEQKIYTINTKSIQKKISKILSKKPIYFKFGSPKLTSKSKRTLKYIAKSLEKSGYKYTLSIEGHTDANGNEHYNKILSRKRAVTVQNYLKKYCKNIKKISSIGYGSSKPKVKNPKSKKNRRVEIIIKRGEK